MTTTIHNPGQSPDPAVLALTALGWILEDEQRAQRLLSLTGLDPASLRAGLSERSIQAAALEFLCQHEPDLLRCSEALAVTPEELAWAGRELAL